MGPLQIVLCALLVSVAVAAVEIAPFKKYPATCKEAKAKKNGIYKMQVNGGEPFNAYCDVTTNGTGWMVVQRRVDAQMNFFRNWSTYQQGFGDLEGSFFIGLDKLHTLTAYQPHELYVHLEDFHGQKRFARYNIFGIGNDADLYGLNSLGLYSGNAGDALRYESFMKFSTYDRDHDNSTLNCAAQFSGAWWYNSCTYSNLNGQYLGGEFGNDLAGRGIFWVQWQGVNYSLKRVQMMIRPLV